MILVGVLLGVVWAVWMLGTEDPDPLASEGGPATGPATPAPTSPGLEVLPRAPAPAHETDPREKLWQGAVLTVRVEEKHSGRVLPGARVSYLAASDLEALWCGGSQDHGEARAERLSQTVIANGQGLVRVPARRSVLLVGRSGDLYGAMTLRCEPGELRAAAERQHRLRLERDVTLRIKVLDHRGVPAAGVPIEILPSSAASSGRCEGAVTISSGDDGIASIAHWQVRVHSRRWTHGLADRLVIRGKIAGAAGSGVAIDPADPPAEVLLQLPATGCIAVRVFGEKEPMAEYCLTLQVIPDDERLGEQVPRVLGTREWTVSVSNGGPARFERVALGRRFRAQYRQDALKAVGVFAGPLRPDQEVSVTLHAVVESTVFVGRAVDPRLEPIRRASLRLVYATKAGAGSRLVVTDTTGRFRINLGHAASQQALIKGQISLASPGESGVGRGLAHRLDPRPLPPGELDLGDIVLGKAPVLASGRILEDGAASQADVDLVVERQRWRADKPVWERDPADSIDFSAPGRFEVRGVARPVRYRLRLASASHLPFEPIEFTPGAEGLEIRLQTGGSLRATLLLGEDIGIHDLDVQLRPGAAPAAGPMALAMVGERLQGRLSHAEAELRSYRWDSLWPGAYAIEVKARGSHEPLATVPVQITAAKAAETDIDLRERLRIIRLRVVGPDGRVVPEGPRNLVLIGGGPETKPRALELRRGNARIVTGEAFADVLVLAEGFLPRRLRGVPGNNTVALKAFPPVTIRVQSELRLLPKDHAMGIRLVRQRATGQHVHPDLASVLGVSTATVGIDTTGTASVPMALDGCYRVNVYVSRGPQSVGVGGVDPENVHVAARTSAQSFQVRVAQAALRDAIASLSTR